MTQTTGVINGTNMLVYLNGTAIAGSKTCEFSLKHAPRETTTKDDAGWDTKAEGLRSWTGKCDGLVAFDASNIGYDDLFGFIAARTKLYVKFSNENTGDNYYHGYVYLTDISMTMPDNTSAGYTCAFDGTGVLTDTVHT